MRIVNVLAVLVVSVAGLTGCAASEQAEHSIDRLAEARTALAGSVNRGGVLVFGTDPTFEPMTFKRGSAYAGLDIDIAQAIAAKLGARVEWRTVPFGDLLKQVSSKQIDASISSMFDRAERQKKVDFVDYLNAGTSIVVPKGTGDIGGMPGLCGRRVAAQPDTVFVDMAKAQKAACGRKNLTVVLTDRPSASVRDGKADAALNDFPIAALDVEKMTSLELSGPQIEAIPYGIGVAKDRKPLTAAIQAALYSAISDGTYDALLTKWKVKEGALRTGAINGGA
ncbi:transporter substrate-binding domain-containing protein [Actinoplanes sp. Pm04-4]|uniref:Transporter substrate-binding domain-containing protein n=1 Tax=Paractinoplanes pyxinae TaxID=2997416 RepID=A0ABT4BGN9_9ACTN|nr:transporter substrate-binding domain-containing protein [Actinoplanes pyxinae]MCY1145701.1 transporter substrate-binding domain-containing protein [Actinoplanes pyxinae]